MPTETTRRSVLKTAVWSAPVVAATVALPLAAASGPTGPTGFSVAAAAVQLPAGTQSNINVTFPADALPIAPGTIVLEYRLVSGTGTILGGGLPPTWTYTWPSATVLNFTPPAAPSLTENVFTIQFSGGTWSVTLRTPQGEFGTQIEMIDPA